MKEMLQTCFCSTMQIVQGWLKPKAILCHHGNSKIELPKVGIVFGCVTFLILDFRLHPITYDPPNHSGGLRIESDIFSNHMGI